MVLIDKIRKISLATGLVLASALTINGLSIPITKYINQSINSRPNTIVFTSGYDNSPVPPSVVSKIVDFFMYTPITLRQNLRGNKVEWVSNSTKEQLLNSLRDPNYQNIVFIGHGSKSSYCTTDEDIWAEDLIDLPSRHGEFIQHTCGGSYGVKRKSLKECLYPDDCGGYSFNQYVRTIENYAKALLELGKELTL